MATGKDTIGAVPTSTTGKFWQVWVPILIVAFIDIGAIAWLSSQMATLPLKKAAMLATPVGTLNVILLAVASSIALAAYLFAWSTFRPGRRAEALWWTGGYDTTRLVALGSVFGALAVAFAGIQARGLGGVNPNLGSTITFLVAATSPSLGLVWLVTMAKGIGAAVWSGNWYVEIAAGIADGFAAMVTWYLAMHTPLGDPKRLWIAGVIGQILRWIPDQIFITPVWAYVILHVPYMAVFIANGLSGYLISSVANGIIVGLLLASIGQRLRTRLAE
jgi:hypothetical protein